MAAKHKSRRRVKRQITKTVESAFDLERLDYIKRTKPIRNRAKLVGVLIAAGVYGAGFVLGFISWQNNAVSYENFAKLVWILMIPSTIVGMFAWLLVTNRREYTVRQDVKAYMQQLESNGGLLWRFLPVLTEINPNEVDCKGVMVQSQQGDPELIAPDDYGKAVHILYDTLKKSGSRELGRETAEELERNLEDIKIPASDKAA